MALSTEELASWRHRFVLTLVERYVPGDVPPAERAEAVRALRVVVDGCSPQALPKKAAVQESLQGPLGPYRERCRQAEEAERISRAHQILDAGFPTNLRWDEFAPALQRMGDLLSARPDATPEEVAAEVLAPLQRASRDLRDMRKRMEGAAHEVEHRWKVEVLMLSLEKQAVLRRNAVRAFEAMDQARIDYVRLLEHAQESRAFEGDLVRIVQERLSMLLKELDPL